MAVGIGVGSVATFAATGAYGIVLGSITAGIGVFLCTVTFGRAAGYYGGQFGGE